MFGSYLEGIETLCSAYIVGFRLLGLDRTLKGLKPNWIMDDQLEAWCTFGSYLEGIETIYDHTVFIFSTSVWIVP